jgi:hypothetical protein
MKRNLKSLGLILSALIALAGFAQNGSYMQFKTSSDKNISGTHTSYYMDGNSRSEMLMVNPMMPGGKMNMIFITQKDKPNTHYQLNETNKTYSEIVSNPEDRAKAGSKDCEVKVLGKEKIGNYNCTHVNIVQGKTTFEMWTTQDIPDYMKYKLNSQKYMGNSKLMQVLADNHADGFPVKTVYHAEGGKEGFVSTELVTFEKRALSADLFQIPADYKKQESPAYTPGSVPSAGDIQKMTPEERQKFVEQMKQMQKAQPPPASK